MPELPEAETVGRALNRVLTGRRIVKVEVFTPKMRTPLTPLTTAGLEGRVFTSVRRRGRYLVAAMDDGRGVLMHFGMSGVARVEGPETPRRRHEHVFLHLDDGNVFRFECPRRFSLLEVRDLGPDGWPDALQCLGVEPLSGKFTGAALYAALAKRKTPVKVALMDNAVVCGIGNIYATETLFASGVDPRRRADTVTPEECAAIVRHAKRILREAIACGGTTIADFRGVDGSEGKFAVKLRIYGKSGEACPRCGATLARCSLGGRTSVFCPGCQQ